MDTLIATNGVKQVAGTRQEGNGGAERGSDSRLRFAHFKEIIEHRIGNHSNKRLSSRIMKKIEHLPARRLEDLWARMRLLDEAVFARGMMQLKREGHDLEVGCCIKENGDETLAVYHLERVRFSPEQERLEAAREILSRMNALRERIGDVCTVIRGANNFRLNGKLGKMNAAAVVHGINNVVQILNLSLELAQKGKKEYLLPKEPNTP